MKASNRLIVNTLAQYGRTIINVVLSLYSARLVLEILGAEDFGIYTLVGGVVAFLSFFTNSMVTATQRFLSVSQGKNDIKELIELFSNSMMIHIAMSVVIAIALAACTPLLFDGFLNIPAGRTEIARQVYLIVIGILVITILAAPYRAALISRENIVYVSIIDVCDGVLKLVMVLLLPYTPIDKLISYAWIMFGIQCFNLFGLAIYGHIKYEECVVPKLGNWRWHYCKQMISFAGWTMYSSFCIAGRNQGLAIVFNKTMGTVINAAYGIGMQLSGYISFLSSSFMTAIAPQLMKAEGGNDRNRALYLASFQSKFSYLLLALIGIPAMFEIDTILGIWLKNVPSHTSLFAIMFIGSMIIDQLTQGLATIINASGKIKYFCILDYTPKLLILPVGALLLYFKLPLWYTCAMFVVIECGCMLLRLPLAKHLIGIGIVPFVKNVFVPIIIPTLASVAISLICVTFLDHKLRLIVTFAAAMIVFSIVSYYTALTKAEQDKIKSIISSLKYYKK